jgi:hypothetical protein
MGHAIAGLFFLRFWVRTRDKLFLSFAAAFSLMAVSQALLTFSGDLREEQSWTYLIRLAAFVLIIIAVLRKNIRPRA